MKGLETCVEYMAYIESNYGKNIPENKNQDRELAAMQLFSACYCAQDSKSLYRTESS